MTQVRNQSVLAVDVGSSSVKLGWFPAAGDCAGKPAASELNIASPALPAPDAMLRLGHAGQPPGTWLAGLDDWLAELPDATAAPCLVSSVHEQAASQLCARLAQLGCSQIVRLAQADVPLELRVSEPDRVGIDRLLGALAVNRLRRPQSPAISVDMGTAITVNLIAADGAFEGGAILPGPGTALAALRAATATLPLVAPHLADPPPIVGKSTEHAMISGAFWGAMGSIEKITAMMADQCPRTPELFLTGGGSQHFARHLKIGGQPAQLVPHLVLTGVWLAAQRLLLS
jgi:type III pantothenate kinase